GDSDHAGDPFTSIKTDEPPSLSLEPADLDISRINQPEIPGLARFAPELAGPELPLEPSTPANMPKSLVARASRARLTEGLSGIATRLHAEDMSAPFSGRDPAMKAKLVRREGGTVHSEKAVQDGLDWIVRHQRSDGGWSLNTRGQCHGDGCPDRGSMD